MTTTVLLQPHFSTETGTYTYSSYPRVLSQYRKKYRSVSTSKLPDGQLPHYNNVMWDRHVIRGSTLGQHQPGQQGEGLLLSDDTQQQDSAKRRPQPRKPRHRELLRVQTPPPVEGRVHVEIQTEVYLEELVDKVDEDEVACQTDPEMARPPSPIFVPAKTGVDVETQIYEGELFDFDVEVEPLLEVLVGKTLEQALREVVEEDELSSIRRQQRKYQELRLAQLAEQQRLVEEDRRLMQEKEKRLAQEKETFLEDRETARKIAAAAFTRSYLLDLVPATFQKLYDAGYLYDPVKKDIEEDFMPWLMDQVSIELTRYGIARTIIDAIIKEAIEQQKAMNRKSSTSRQE